MIMNGRIQRDSLIFRGITMLVLCAFIVSLPGGVSAQDLMWMPPPGVRVSASPEFNPPVLKGITINPQNPLQFDFLIDQGDKPVPEGEKQDEYRKLVKYFLASLTLPEKDLWVNLSPYEKDRIIADNFGQTEMGRDLLSQDYVLKQLTASMIYPEEQLGKTFWDKVYQAAYEKFGSTEVSVNTFNKVWIVPDEAVVYESGNTAIVLKSHLKVMLEEDYVALSYQKDSAKSSTPVGDVAMSHQGIRGQGSIESAGSQTPPAQDVNQLGSQIVREIIIPAIEKEVNEGKNFALLRQIYSGMILATWYKKSFKESLLGRVYVDKGKVMGIDLNDKEANHKIYTQYLEAFKKGAYNYIKEDYDKYTQEIIPRKYFSGGFATQYKKEMPDGSVQFSGLRDLRIVDDTAMDAAMLTVVDSLRNEVASGDVRIDQARVSLREEGELSPRRRGPMREWFGKFARNLTLVVSMLGATGMSAYPDEILNRDQVNHYLQYNQQEELIKIIADYSKETLDEDIFYDAKKTLREMLNKDGFSNVTMAEFKRLILEAYKTEEARQRENDRFIREKIADPDYVRAVVKEMSQEYLPEEHLKTLMEKISSLEKSGQFKKISEPKLKEKIDAAYLLFQIENAQIKLDPATIKGILDKVTKAQSPYEYSDAVTKIGAPAVSGLIEILNNPDISQNDARSWAVRRLSDISRSLPKNNELRPQLISAFIDLLIDPGDYFIALYELQQMGWVPKNEEEEIRYLIAKRDLESIAFLESKGKAAIPYLKMAFNRNPDVIKRQLLETMAKIGSKLSQDPLERSWVVTTILPEITNAINHKSGFEQTTEFASAVEMLAPLIMEDTRMRESLIPILTAGLSTGSLRDRSAFAQTLKKLDWKPATQLEKIRQLYAEGQGDSLIQEGKAAHSILLEGLKEGDPMARVFSLKALAGLFGVLTDDVQMRISITSAIAGALNDEKEEVKIAALTALKQNIVDLPEKSERTRIVNLMIGMLQDKSYDVKNKAINNLQDVFGVLKSESDLSDAELIVDAFLKIGRRTYSELAVFIDSTTGDQQASLKNKIIPAVLSDLKERPIDNDSVFDFFDQAKVKLSIAEYPVIAGDIIPAQIKALTDENINIRKSAAEALGKMAALIDDDSIIDTLMIPEMLNSLNVDPIVNTGYVFGFFKAINKRIDVAKYPVIEEKIIPAAKALLAETAFAKKKEGVLILGNVVNILSLDNRSLSAEIAVAVEREFLPDLFQRMEDTDPAIRKSALESIPFLYSFSFPEETRKKIVTLLINTLKDKDPDIRKLSTGFLHLNFISDLKDNKLVDIKEFYEKIVVPILTELLAVDSGMAIAAIRNLNLDDYLSKDHPQYGLLVNLGYRHVEVEKGILSISDVQTIYANDYFRKVTGAMQPVNQFSAARAIINTLKRFGLHVEPRTVSEELVDFVQKTINDFSQQVFWDENTHLVIVAHEEDQFDPDTIKRLAVRAGVKSENITSFVGLGDKEAAGGVQTNEERALYKQKILDTIVNSPPGTFFYFNGHGGTNHFWLKSGLIGVEYSEWLNHPFAISYKELSEAYIKRAEKWGNELVGKTGLSKDSSLCDACYGQDNFSRLSEKLTLSQKEGKIKALPFLITASSIGTTGYGNIFWKSSYLLRGLNETHTENQPITGVNFLKAEDWKGIAGDGEGTAELQDMGLLLPLTPEQKRKLDNIMKNLGAEDPKDIGPQYIRNGPNKYQYPDANALYLMVIEKSGLRIRDDLVAQLDNPALTAQTEASDSAMFTRKSENDFIKGGIDFNSANLNLQIKRDGQGVPLPIDMQNMQNINIDGFVPEILKITPVTRLPVSANNYSSSH